MRESSDRLPRAKTCEECVNEDVKGRKVDTAAGEPDPMTLFPVLGLGNTLTNCYPSSAELWPSSVKVERPA